MGPNRIDKDGIEELTAFLDEYDDVVVVNLDDREYALVVCRPRSVGG